MGQPISIGSREWNWGSISLDEVSIVRQGAVKGYAPPAVIGVDAFEPADVDRAVVVDPNRDPAWVPSLGLERRLVKRCARWRALDRRHMHRYANRNQLREVGPAAVAHRSALNRSRRSFASSSRAAVALHAQPVSPRVRRGSRGRHARAKQRPPPRRNRTQGSDPRRQGPRLDRDGRTRLSWCPQSTATQTQGRRAESRSCRSRRSAGSGFRGAPAADRSRVSRSLG